MHKSITLEVTGDQKLVCEGCEQRVEHLVKAMQGVRQAHAQARNQRIEVLFDSSVLDATAITERIGDAGYQTKVVGSDSVWFSEPLLWVGAATLIGTSIANFKIKRACCRAERHPAT